MHLPLSMDVNGRITNTIVPGWLCRVLPEALNALNSKFENSKQHSHISLAPNHWLEKAFMYEVYICGVFQL